MMNTVTCQVCTSIRYKQYLEIKDHSVTKEHFKILQCEICQLLQTDPVPKKLDRYYASNQYISHADNPDTFIDHVYFKAREYALAWKEKLISKNNPVAQTLLDYGCGTGAFLKYCEDKKWNVMGVEPFQQAHSIAQKNLKAFVGPDIESIDQTNFEVITLWHVLEHLTDLNGTLHLLKEKLSENGTMFIAVPNYKSKDAKYYSTFWAAYDVPRHLWHFSQTTMQELTRKHGLKVESVLPMKLDAYYVSMLSEKYKRNNNTTISGLLSAILNGFRSNLDAKKTGEYSSLIYVIRHETI